MALTQEQIKAGYSTIPGAYDPVTGKLITPTSTPPVSTYAGVSIVDYLKSLGKDSSLASRIALGKQYGIDYSKSTTNYATENTVLLNKLREGGTGVPDYSNINTVSDANKAINEGQDGDVIDKEGEDAPKVKSSYSGLLDTYKDVTSAIKPTTPPPATPDLTQKFTDLRSQYGVEALETQLNDLKAQQDILYAQQRIRTAAEKGKPVAMGVIEGRVGEIERQEAERIDTVQRQMTNISNQLNTKYQMIDTYMKLADMDYDNAVAAYDRDFANNVTLFNIVRGIDDSEKADEERAVDNARANAQIMINTMTDKNMTYDQLSPDQQLTLTKLSVQAGLGADFFSTVMNVNADKKVLTTIVSPDKTNVTIVNTDGTTKVVPVGVSPGVDDETNIKQEPLTSEDVSLIANGLIDQMGKQEAIDYISSNKQIKMDGVLRQLSEDEVQQIIQAMGGQATTPSGEADFKPNLSDKAYSAAKSVANWWKGLWD